MSSHSLNLLLLMSLSYFILRPENLDGQHKYWLSHKTKNLVILGPVHMSLLIDYKFSHLSGEMTSLPTS